MTSLLLRDATVLDESGGFTGPVDVLVVDGTVSAVGPNLRAPADVLVADFADLFVLPGLVDAHTHPAISSLDALENLRTPISEWALETGHNLRRTLEGGVTLIRDACVADAGMKAAVEKGFVDGPHMLISVVAIGQTGGHLDDILLGSGSEISLAYIQPELPGIPAWRADGADEVRKAVRQTLRAGADWIKLVVSGGILAAHEWPEQVQYTREEIGVAVFEAERKGRRVMVHAYGGEGLDIAVEAGVASVEHGTFLTEAQAKKMADAGCWLVPTLTMNRLLIDWAEQGTLNPAATERLLELKPKVDECVQIAKEYGVKMAMGTDAFIRDLHGRNAAELSYLRRGGLSPEEALLVGTINGAELCGRADRYGRIEPGFVFDAIVLDGDPGDLSVFEEGGAVTGVFKNGTAVVRHPRLTTPRSHTVAAG